MLGKLANAVPDAHAIPALRTQALRKNTKRGIILRFVLAFSSPWSQRFFSWPAAKTAVWWRASRFRHHAQSCTSRSAQTASRWTPATGGWSRYSSTRGTRYWSRRPSLLVWPHLSSTGCHWRFHDFERLKFKHLCNIE